MIKPGSEWDLPSATSAYNIDRWGAGYFSINAKGHAQVTPLLAQGAAIDVMDVVSEAREQGLGFPLVIRFQDLLRHRVETICRAFSSAIAEAGYQKPYRGVFPIKVNQLREVVEEILDAGAEFHFGLECGSKPELFAALAVHRDTESVIICNGYKDAIYIQTALLGRKLGKQIIMVVEKIEELRQIVEISREMNVEPLVGLRVRLNTRGAGKWATSGGREREVRPFHGGILVSASEYLKANNLAHCLKLVHFHVGSQVPDIRTIKRAVREAARFYAKLAKMGHDLEYHRRGRRPRRRLRRLAHGVRQFHELHACRSTRATSFITLWTCAIRRRCAHPIIVSESGRALVAHHSMLVIEAFGAIEKDAATRIEVSEKDAKLVQDISETQKGLSKENRLEALHDALQYKEQAQAMFELGLLDLETKAKVEGIYWQIARNVVRFFEGMRYIPEEVRESVEQPRGSVLLQFLGVPVAARPLGVGAVVPDHAHSPAQRVAGTQCHHGRYHVRLGRQDQQVHRPPGREGLHPPTRSPAGRAVLSRVVSRGRVPGHHGRPAQSFRPRDGGPCLPR